MRKTLPWIYLILAILGAVLPWRANLEFMAESSGSFDFQRFVADASATAAARSLGADLNLSRPPLFVLIAIGLLLLLPAGAGRVLLDLAGGLLVVFLVLPILLGGLGWVGWKVLQSRMQSCSACGAVGLGSNLQCSVCGNPYTSQPGA